MSILTVFQSYQDDEMVLMKGCVQWNLVYDGKISPSSGSQKQGPLNQQTNI